MPHSDPEHGVAKVARQGSFRVTAAMRSTNRVAAALAYAEAGVSVLLLYGVDAGRCGCGRSKCPSPGKHPISSAFPHGHRSATTDSTVLRRLLREQPDANIGIVPSDGLFVVDIDTKAGCVAVRALGLPQTVSVATNRGQHLYFDRAPSAPRPAKIVGTDFRFGANGYVVAPPSAHILGTRYTWSAALDRAAVLNVDDLPAVPPSRSLPSNEVLGTVVRDAVRIDPVQIFRHFSPALHPLTRRRLSQGSVCGPFALRIGGKVHRYAGDDRSVVIWQIAADFRHAGAKPPQALAVVMNSVFWRARQADGKRDDPLRFITRIYAEALQP